MPRSPLLPKQKDIDINHVTARKRIVCAGFGGQTFHRGVSVVGEVALQQLLLRASPFDFPIVITFPPLPRTLASP